MKKNIEIFHFWSFYALDLPLTATKLLKRSILIIFWVCASSNLPFTASYLYLQVNV